MKKQFTILPGEYWWGGSVNQGHQMPFHEKSVCEFDPLFSKQSDQFAPFFVSSKGRYIWSEKPFILKAKAGGITCEGHDEILLKDGFGSLRSRIWLPVKRIFRSLVLCRTSAFSPSRSTIHGSSLAQTKRRIIFCIMQKAYWHMLTNAGIDEKRV